MKKTASILLLALLAFNWIGYRLLTVLLEHRSEANLQSRITHAEYDEKNLISLTVTLNTPYLSGASTGFEPYDAEIDLNGVHYHCVKRRIVDGTLVLLCLPNEKKDQLQHSRTEFFKLVNDLNTTTHGKEKNSASSKSFSPEYSPEKNYWTIEPLKSSDGQDPAINVSMRASGFHTVVKQPPRA